MGARCSESSCPSWGDFQHLLLEIHPVLLLALQLLQAAVFVFYDFPRYLQKSGMQTPAANQPLLQLRAPAAHPTLARFPFAPQPRGYSPEQELLPGFLLNDIQLIIVAQGTRHLLVGHVHPVLEGSITSHPTHTPHPFLPTPGREQVGLDGF